MTNAHPVWLGSLEQVKIEAAGIRQKLQDIRENFKRFCNPAGNLMLDKAREYFSSQNEDLYEFCSTYRRKYLELPKDKMVVMTKQYQEDQRVIAHLRVDIQDLENRLVELQPRSTGCNPEVTDLSDENRPTKLGENFKQLYEDEWIDAFEFLTEKRKKQVLPDKSTIEMLFNMLKVCHEACQETWKRQYTTFAEIVNNPTVVTPIQTGKTHMGQLNKPKMQVAHITGRTNTSNNEIGTYSGYLDVPIKEFCKQFAMKMFHHFKPSDIIRAVGTKQEIPEDILQNEYIQKFIIKCFQLCWMMQAQYPPMVIDFNTQPGIPYNQALFEVYTTRGKNVAYVVWPSVYLHKDGPVVCKGYVECIK